ncbi:hypothetical protein MANES_01G137501v8 [Manihot esculenta]|uniref:Uncharacterized protein n=1 Tax=Manihot esculenta TaxID=3983 RepID=A0ACB7IHQ1_MANES|nr:hypothetical protein MANES_01G137501v8 [Manihot esculenta]
MQVEKNPNSSKKRMLNNLSQQRRNGKETVWWQPLHLPHIFPSDFHNAPDLPNNFHFSAIYYI